MKPWLRTTAPAIALAQLAPLATALAPVAVALALLAPSTPAAAQ